MRESIANNKEPIFKRLGETLWDWLFTRIDDFLHVKDNYDEMMLQRII
jgi:hypothetical protein